MTALALRSTLAALLLASASACVQEQPPQQPPPPSPYGQPGPQQPGPQQPGPGPQQPGPQARPQQPPPPSGEMGPPVTLQVVQAGGSNAGAGEVDVNVFIDTHEALSFPVTLRVEVPAGGAVVAGAPQETLTLSQPGRQARAYRLKSSGPLSAQQPFRFILEGRSQSAGVRAEKRFPEGQGAAPPPVQPGPPGGRPPGPAGGRPQGPVPMPGKQ